MNHPSPLALAIKAVGGQIRLSQLIGVPQTTISTWLVRYNGRVPAEVCAAIETATNGQITKAMLRSDLFAASTPVESREGSPAE